MLCLSSDWKSTHNLRGRHENELHERRGRIRSPLRVDTYTRRETPPNFVPGALLNLSTKVSTNLSVLSVGGICAHKGEGFNEMRI